MYSQLMELAVVSFRYSFRDSTSSDAERAGVDGVESMLIVLGLNRYHFSEFNIKCYLSTDSI